MTEVSNIVSEEISVVYEDHMGSDLTVVNAARQSFAKQKKVFSENDVGLINFLEMGMRTDDKVVLKKKFLRYKNKAQHWEPFGHPQRNQACKLNYPPIKAEHQSLYPTLSSLDEVVVAAQDVFPAEYKNALFNILMTYNNTLLNQINQ